MKNHSLILVMAGLLALVSPVSALDEAAIKELLTRPHSRENLLPELKVFGDLREFDVELTITGVGADPLPLDSVRVTQKMVEGKYLVGSSNPPGGPGQLVTVTTFDQKRKVYRRWVLLPGFQKRTRSR